MEAQHTDGVEPELSVEAINAIAPEPPPRKRRPFRRFILWSLGTILVVLLVAVAAAPTAAGWFAPGMVAGALRGRIQGTATVEHVSLSWFGSQHVGPVIVKDDAGAEVARVEVTVSRGLWGLGLGGIGLSGLDAGEIAVAGKAMIVREADGTINLQRVFKPAGGSAPPPAPGSRTPGEPVRLPSGLAATLAIDKLDVTFVDKSAAAPPGAAAIRIANIKGGGQIAAGKPGTFKLAASAWYGESEAAATNPAGTLSVTATVDRLIDSTSRLTPHLAKFDAVVEVKDASILLADAFAGTKDAMARGFGDRITIALKAAGTADDATADLTAAAPGLSADLAIRYADSVLTAPRAGTLRARTVGLVPLVPGLQEAIDAQAAAKITTWPEVSIGLQSLRMKLPTGGAAPDLRGGSLALTVKSTELLGTLMAPALDEGEGTGEVARRALRVAPMTLTVSAPDLGGPVKVRADTAARLSDESAGNLQLDVTAEGLLDDHGAPIAGPPRKLNGRLVVKEIATALGQPLVEKLGLDLPRDIGPRLDIVVAAAARAQAGEASAEIPRTDVDVTVRSGKLQSTAALTLDETGIRGRDMPDAPAIRFSLASATPIAARLLNKSGTAKAAGQGPLTISVTGLHVPLAAGTRAPDLVNAAASAKVGFGGLSIEPVPAKPGGAQPAGAAAGGGPVTLDRIELVATLAPGRAPGVAIDSALAHAGQTFALKGSLALEGLMRAGTGGGVEFNPDAALPVGTLTLEGVPTTLAAFAPAAPTQPGKPVIDVARLVQDAIGPTVNVSLETVIAEARADRLNARLAIDSPTVKGRINGGLLPDRFDVAKSEVRAALTPALAESVLAAFAPTLTPRPRLAAPATLVVAIEPTRVPFVKGKRFTPDLASAGDLNLRVTTDGRLTVENLALNDAGGKPRDIGPAALQKLEVAVAAPIPALVAGGKTAPASVSVMSDLLAGATGAELTPLGRLDVEAKLELAAGAPAGPGTATVKLTEFSTAQLDRILAQPGLLTGALGPGVSVEAGAEAEFVKPGSAAEGAGAFERIALTVTPAAAKLKTERPLKAVLTPDRLALDTPMVFAWTMDGAFADRYLLGTEAPPSTPAPTPPGTPTAASPGVRFASPTEFRIAVQRLGLATGEAPMKPGVFGVDASIDAPAVHLAMPDGTPARFDALKMRVQAGGEQQRPGTAGFSLRMASQASPVEVSGGLYGLHDEAGKPTPEAVRVTARAEARAFPTVIVDALARHQGLLVEALGPTMTLEAEASGVSLQRGGDRGKLTATFSSPRATAKLDGGVNSGVFVAHGPVTFQLVEITPALGAELVSGLPMVGAFQKRPEDGPATLTGTNLRVPVDGDVRKLNGDLVLNLGLVRFDTSGVFSGLLRGLGQRDQGTLGRRVAPFRASFKDGVMTYEKYTLPLGEFSVDIQGEVDFGGKTMDVVTYIPLGALSDEAAGAFNTGLGRLLSKVPVLDKATMMPFRTRGAFGKPRTEPDPGLFVKEFGGALNPLNILKPDKDKGGG